MSFDPSAAPLIEETLLKNRRSLDELAHIRSVTVKQQNKRKRVVRGEDIRIKRPEQFVREYRIREGSQNKMQRRKKQMEKRARVDVPLSEIQDTVGFVVRIHGGRHASAEIKSILSEMGLSKKYDARFMKLDEKTIGNPLLLMINQFVYLL